MASDEEWNNTVAQKLRTIKIFIKAGAFDKAENMLTLLEKAEEERNGCCENAEVYWCKVLTKYQARDEAELVAKSPAVDDDIDFTLAIEFSKNGEQRQIYSTILEKLKQSRKEGGGEEGGSAGLNIGDFNEIGGSYVTFGAYPQSKKADNVRIGKIFDKVRGYYLGSDDNLYDEWNDVFYKVEPIKWKVLSYDDDSWFIVADIILEPHNFANSSNNYAESELRSWLNGEFYNKAFLDSQKSKIVTTTVDNSLLSTRDSENPYICNNTSDKVYLLSRKEAAQFLGEKNRKRVPTEYAVARGAWKSNSNDKRNGKDCGYWWLRTPSLADNNYALCILVNGDYNSSGVISTNCGVVPAIKIKP